MPCYQIQTMSVEFKAENKGLLAKAAESLGLVLSERAGMLVIKAQAGNELATIQGGKATCRSVDLPTINKLRVAYSKQVVGAAALRMGWQKVVQSDRKLQLTKG